MKLKVKFLNWSAGIPVVMLSEKTASEIGVHAQERISIRTFGKNSQQMSTIVDTVGSPSIRDSEIVVSEEIKKFLNLKKREKIEVDLAPSPKSLDFIKKKLNGKIISKKEIHAIIEDVVTNSLSEAEIALFVSAMYRNGMNFVETVGLIDAILKTGTKLHLKNKIVADKHSIGGLPGRVTIVVVSICAAAGLIMPKTSSRAITTAAGTADSMEVICGVDFSIKEVKKIISKTGACIVWGGGGLEMAPADSKIIGIEKKLGIDPRSQLIASIMAKKLAMGAKYILIDIPYGKGAKVNKKEALDLKRRFEKIGKHFKLKMKVVLTDGTQPTGNGVGPALELIDAIKVLDPEQEGPEALDNKSLLLSGHLLELTGKAKKRKGMAMAREILDSGKAFEKFNEIVNAQGKKINKIYLGKYRKIICARKKGKVVEMDSKKINFFARAAGCPMDKFAGVYLHKKTGEEFNKGEKLITIYAESKARLKEAFNFYKKEKPIVFE